MHLIKCSNFCFLHALFEHEQATFILKLGKHCFQTPYQRVRELAAYIALFNKPLVCKSHSISRKHTCIRMNENAFDPKAVCNPAGVLGSSSSETAEGIFFYVVSPLDRDFLDSICHILNCNRKEAFGYLLRCPDIAVIFAFA